MIIHGPFRVTYLTSVGKVGAHPRRRIRRTTGSSSIQNMSEGEPPECLKEASEAASYTLDA
jgi:hypothetical protein